MNTETKGKALVEFEKIILNVHKVAYNQGEKDGRKNGVDEYQQELEREFEKSNTEYVATQFSYCKTLSDFQNKFNEIRNRSYNFM